MSSRVVIQPPKSDKRDLRRDEHGHFIENQVNVGKSLSADRGQKARILVPNGQGDGGDEKRS